MKDLPPFSCTNSQGLAEFLQNQQCSLAISTYQAGKVIFISPRDNDHIVQLPRNFSKPMGLALQGDRLAIATRNEVVVLGNSRQLAVSYPAQAETYDNLFIPRAVYYTGELDIHDIHWVDDTLLAVNTRFSCLATIDGKYNFTPVWRPAFIDKLKPEDHCHLNGVAFEHGKPKYATALGCTSTPGGWRDKKASGGILIDIERNEVIAENLPMPHSPRLYDGGLYLLLSATGELVKMNLLNGTYDVVRRMDGFVRGMDRSGDYVFIGLSKLRKTSTSFGDLAIADRSPFCGVVALHLPSGSVAHYLRYENSVEEIFDVRVLPGMMRPGILNAQKPEFRRALATPTQTFWARKTEEDDDK